MKKSFLFTSNLSELCLGAFCTSIPLTKEGLGKKTTIDDIHFSRDGENDDTHLGHFRSSITSAQYNGYPHSPNNSVRTV